MSASRASDSSDRRTESASQGFNPSARLSMCASHASDLSNTLTESPSRSSDPSDSRGVSTTRGSDACGGRSVSASRGSYPFDSLLMSPMSLSPASEFADCQSVTPSRGSHRVDRLVVSAQSEAEKAPSAYHVVWLEPSHVPYASVITPDKVPADRLNRSGLGAGPEEGDAEHRKSAGQEQPQAPWVTFKTINRMWKIETSLFPTVSWVFLVCYFTFVEVSVQMFDDGCRVGVGDARWCYYVAVNCL